MGEGGPSSEREGSVETEKLRVGACVSVSVSVCVCVSVVPQEVISDSGHFGVTITGAPSHQHSGPASPASRPEPSCLLLRQVAGPPGTFFPPPLLAPCSPSSSPAPPLQQEGLSRSPGSWSSSRAEGSHPALPLGAISPAGMPPEAVPAPGRNKIKSPQRSPSQYPLLLLWASLLSGPVPGQVRWSRGQEAGSLGGGAHCWSRARTRCPQLLSVQRLDTCWAPPPSSQ